MMKSVCEFSKAKRGLLRRGKRYIVCNIVSPTEETSGIKTNIH
jgi:hypothetical protein